MAWPIGNQYDCTATTATALLPLLLLQLLLLFLLLLLLPLLSCCSSANAIARGQNGLTRCGCDWHWISRCSALALLWTGSGLVGSVPSRLGCLVTLPIRCPCPPNKATSVAAGHTHSHILAHTAQSHSPVPIGVCFTCAILCAYAGSGQDEECRVRRAGCCVLGGSYVILFCATPASRILCPIFLFLSISIRAFVRYSLLSSLSFSSLHFVRFILTPVVN